MESYLFLSIILNILVGIVFIISAFSKFIRPFDFIRQLSEYEMISPKNVAEIAFILTGLELILGVMLVTHYLMPVTSYLLIGLLLLFITVLMIKKDTRDNCGCFSSFIKRTPKQAVAEDIVLILMLSVSLVLASKKPAFAIPFWQHLVVVIMALFSLMAYLVFRFATKYYPRFIISRLKQGKSITKVVVEPAVNWIDEKVLIVVASTTCSFCKMQRPLINAMAKIMNDGKFGRVITIYSENDSAVEKDWYNPHVRVCRAKSAVYNSMVDLGVPRSAWIENGIVTKSWESGVPVPWVFLDNQNPNYLKNKLALELLKNDLNYSNLVNMELFEILFEQGENSLQSGYIDLAEKFFFKATETTNNCFACTKSLVAKSYFNLAATQVHLEKIDSASENYKIAAHMFIDAKKPEDATDAYAKSHVMAKVADKAQFAREIIDDFALKNKEYPDQRDRLVALFNDVCMSMINEAPIQ